MGVDAGTPIENHVLRGLSLEIPQGQFVSVIGSNGAGKSTTLNAISGDSLVDSGRIQIDDKDVTKLSACERAPWVARVFQDPMAGTCESARPHAAQLAAEKRAAPEP
jgi:putative tryptophan/tyrosine transport system ATP-binding protein